MDPVTMVDVLIATGFSVDYTAHIAYKFYKLHGCRQERIRQSLHEMCGPMLQVSFRELQHSQHIHCVKCSSLIHIILTLTKPYMDAT